MLDDSDLRIADVAFASGYGSLRQFNRELREIFQAPPRELRDRRRRSDRLVADGGLVLRLPFNPPYDWETTAAFLAAHTMPGLGHGLTHAFPAAEALVGDELVGPLAREVAAGNLLLDGVESAEVLERLPGVTARAARQVVARVS